jgi:hypothetical protein
MNKKLTAMIFSALMIGVTLGSPVLATSVTKLEDISKLVTVTDSTVSFPIFVIGSTAATSDVAGAVDVAVNLAANAKTTSSVTTTIVGETVTGGAKVATSGIYLTPWYNPQNVKGIYTASDIADLLKDGTYSSGGGANYVYKQYLYLLGETTLTGTAGTNYAAVVYDRPTTENTPRISFKTPTGVALYRYKLAFSTPVSMTSATTQPTIDTLLQGTTINFLGKDFVISAETYGSGASPITDLTLLGGKNLVTVDTTAPKTTTLSGKDYTVTLSGVAAQTVGTTTYYTAIGDVNGESFTLKAGDTKLLTDGTKIAAIKVFQGKTGATDYATLAIGADQIKLAAVGTVTIGNTVNAELTATFTQTAAAWSALTIDYAPSTAAWISAGGQITDPLASAFNIKFNSIIPDFTDTANRQTITLSPGGYNMYLTYKNAAGNEKQMYTLLNDSGAWYWASANIGTVTNADNVYRDVVFDEGKNISAIDQDYFVIGKAGFSHVMMFTSFTPTTSSLTFTDEAGNSITATNTSATAGSLIVDGNAYVFNIVDGAKKKLNIDLNGDGYIAGIVAASYNGIGNTTGREYAFLTPKLITSGQGGLYFYDGNKGVTLSGTAGTNWQYPALGFGGIRIGNSSASNVVVQTYSGAGVWTNAATNITATLSDVNVEASASFTYNYIDFTVRITNTTATDIYANVGLGTSNSSTAFQTSKGFILVEEAQMGGTTHSWLFFPIAWDTTNTRTYINTPKSDDSSYSASLSVLGTATQYKGMTTYGTLVDYLSSNLGGSATISYPDVFTYANLYIMTPTGVITSGGAGGQVTTEKVLPITGDVVKLDSEVTSSDKTNSDFVLVGGPCKNTLVADLATAGKFPYTCANWPGRNFGRIQLVSDGFATGKTVLVIAGTRAEETDLAARIVQNGLPSASATQKAGASVEVTGTVSSPAYS